MGDGGWVSMVMEDGPVSGLLSLCLSPASLSSCLHLYFSGYFLLGLRFKSPGSA